MVSSLYIYVPLISKCPFTKVITTHQTTHCESIHTIHYLAQLYLLTSSSLLFPCVLSDPLFLLISLPLYLVRHSALKLINCLRPDL